MEYDKRRFQKLNDKKVLHKVKKHWVVLSLSLLAMLGTGAVKTTETHASTLNPDGFQSKRPVSGNALGRQLWETSQTSQSYQNLIHNQQSNPADINQQAEVLHQRILRNAVESNQNYGRINPQPKREQVVVRPEDRISPREQGQFQQMERSGSTTDVQQRSNDVSATPVGQSKPATPPSIPTSQISASGAWGTSHWVLDKQGNLYLNGGDMNDYNHIVHDPDVGDTYSDGHGYNLVGHDNYAKYSQVPGYTIPANLDTTKVQHIYTYGNVKAPEESEGLFANNSDNMSATPGVDYNVGGFGHFNHLKSVDLSGMDMSDVFSTKDMFRGDYQLQKAVGFNNHSDRNNYLFDTSAMFYSDYDLSDVDITKLDTISNTWIDNMFMHNRNLKRLDLSNFDTRRIMDHDKKNNGSFEFDNFVGDTPQLSTIILGPHTIVDANTGLNTGRGWIHLQNGHSALIKNGSFQYDPGVWSATTQQGQWGSSNWAMDQQGDLILDGGTITANRGDATGNPQWNRVKHIYTNGVNAGNSLVNTFAGLPNLQIFDGTGLNVSNVYDLDGCFINNPNLISLSGLYNWNTGNVGSMNGVFGNDTSLQNLYGLSDWDVNNVGSTAHQGDPYGFENMFAGDTGLTNALSLQNWNTNRNVSITRMFAGDRNLEEIRLTNNFVLGEGRHSSFSPGSACLPSTWVNYDHPNNQIADINQERTPGLYFNTQNCVRATINYRFGNQTIYTYDNWMPKTFDSHHLPGQGASQMQDYEVDPRLNNPTYHLASNSTTTIQLDRKGKWGSATWDLTPPTINSSDHALTDKYGRGNLFVHDGTLSETQTNAQHNQLTVELGINSQQASDIYSIDTKNDVAPQSCTDLFDEENGDVFPHLTQINVSGIDVSHTTGYRNMWAVFAGLRHVKRIIGLSDWDTGVPDDVEWMFTDMPALQEINLSAFNVNGNDGGAFSGTPALSVITLGPNTRLNGSAKLGSVAGYNVNNHSQVVSNLEDGNAHPGTWRLTDGNANVAFKFGNRALGNHQVPVSGGHAYASDLKTSAHGVNYELDPRIDPAVPMNSGGNYTVQLDRVGHWGSATWDLTPVSDVNGNQAVQKYGKGNLFVHDGTLTTDEKMGNMFRATGLTPQQANNVYSLDTKSDVLPSASNNLFNGQILNSNNLSHFNNLTTIDVSGVNTNNCQDMFGIMDVFPKLRHIYGLSDWNTSGVNDLQYAFCVDPELEYLDFGSFNTRNASAMKDLFTGDSSLDEITLGSDTILNNSACLRDRGSQGGYNVNNRNQTVPNIEDGHSHPGTWRLTNGNANVIFKFGNHQIGGPRSIPTNDGRAYASDLTVSSDGVNYELDPRLGQTVSLTGGGNHVVQLDRTGHWGSATWDLTPVSDLASDLQKYGQGNLFVHDGTLTGDGSTSSLYDSLGINGSVANDINSISSKNDNLPTLSNRLFDDESGHFNHLTSIDVSGLNTDGVQQFYAMFCGLHHVQHINGLEHFNTQSTTLSAYDWMFSGDPVVSLNLSTFNTIGRYNTQESNDMFAGDSSLNELILGPQTIIINQDQLGHPNAYNVSNPNDVRNLEDGRPHPGTWRLIDGNANVTFKFGNQALGNRQVHISGGYAYASDLKTSANGLNYELDPRIDQEMQMNNGGNYTIQLDQTGKWGSATWDLTPVSDLANGLQKYGEGNLFVHDGTLATTTTPNGDTRDSLYNSLGIKQASSDVYSISTQSDVAPQNSNYLFNDETENGGEYFHKLSQIDVSGLNTDGTNNMYDMFGGLASVQKIIGLNNLNMTNVGPNISYMFVDDSSLGSLDLRSLNNMGKAGITEQSMLCNTPSLHEIILGPNTVLNGSSQLTNGPWGYNVARPAEVQKLVDGQPHSGTWAIPASVTLHYRDIYSDIDGMKNPADHTVNVTSPNYHLKSSDVPSGYKLVDSNGKIIQPGAVSFASAGPYDVTIAPCYRGMVYKYNQTDPNNRTVEFTNGTPDNQNLSGFLLNIPANAQGFAGSKVVKFDSDIDFSHVTDMSDLFSSNQSIQQIILPHNFNTSSVTNMDRMFNSDHNLREIDNLSDASFYTSSVNKNNKGGDMGWMFWGANSLSSLSFGPNFNTIGKDTTGMFGNNAVSGNPSDDNALNTIKIQSSGTKFNNMNIVNEHWLPAGNGVTDPVNLADGKSHVGTWTRNAEIVDYDYDGQSKGKYRVSQPLGTSATVNGTNLQPGWHITNNHPDSFIVNGGEFKEGVSPNIDSDYVQYRYNGKLMYTGRHIRGNDVNSRVDGTFTISNNSTPKGSDIGAPGLPAGWHVKSGDGIDQNGLTFDHMNSSHQVYIEPNTYSEKVDYRVQNNGSYAKKNQILASDTTTLNDKRATAAGNNSLTIDGSNHPNLSEGYHLVKNYNFSHPAGQNYSDQALIAPNSVNQHINYQWYNRSVGSTNINGDYDNTGTINGTGLDAGWHVNDSATFNDTDGQGRFTFNGGTTNIGVLPNQETIPVVLYSGNQNNVIDQFSLSGSNSDRLNLMDHVPRGFSVNSSAARTALQNYVVGEGMNSGGVTGGGLSTQNPSNGTGSVNSVYVPVSPNVTLTVHVFYENSNGQLTSSDDRQVSVFAQPGGAVFYPGELSPDNSHSSYVLDTERTLPSDQVLFDGQNVSWVNGEPTVYFKDVEAAVKAVFINQAGQQVGQPVFYSGIAGNSVHMISDNHIASASPDYSLTTSKYSVAPGQSQYQNFVLQPGEHTVYIHLQGNSDPNAKVNVVCLLRQPDGSYHRSDESVPLSNYAYGDSDWLTPSDVRVQGYSPLPLDHSQDVKITPNILNGQKVVFYYEKTPTGDGTLLVHYINPDGWVLKSSEITEPVGGRVTLPDDAPLPEGYDLSSGDQTYTITDTPQETSVPVTGKQVNGLVLKLHRFTQDPDGRNRVVNTYQIRLSGQIGDSFHISPYGYVSSDNNQFSSTKPKDMTHWHSLTPSGYYVNPSDRDQDVTITPNQQLSQTSLYYGYTKDFQSVGAVTIHYVTGPNQTDVDTVSDHGITGQSFDIQPYLDDLPADMSNNYVLANPSLYSDSGLSHQIQGSLTFGNTPNVYIRLNKVD